jgi:chorismate mutase
MFRRLFLALPWVLAARAQPDPLVEARRRIDAVDERLVALLNERAKIVDEISRIKKAKNLPVSDPKRFQQVLEKAVGYSKGPLPPAAVKNIYQRLVEVMQEWEATR